MFYCLILFFNFILAQNLSSEECENISQTLNEDNDSTQSLQPMIVSSDEEIISINTINISSGFCFNKIYNLIFFYSVPELIEESDSGLQTMTTVEMTSNVRITYVIIYNDKQCRSQIWDQGGHGPPQKFLAI